MAQSRLGLLHHGLESGVPDELEHDSRISDGNSDAAAGSLLNDDVARQEKSDLRLQFQRLSGKGRVASAEDHITAEVHIELLLECLPDVDFREDAESFGPEGFGNLLNGAVKVSFSNVFSYP